VASVGREVTDGHRKNSRFEINSGYIKGGTEITDNFTLTVDASISKFIAYEPGTASAPKLNGWADILRGYTGIAIDNKFSESVGSIRILHNLGKHKISDGFESNDNNSSFTFYQTLHLFENNTFTVGADYKQYGGEAKNVQANFNFGNFSAEETGVYAHLQHSFFNILTISGGLRYEYSPKFGDVLIPQIGAAYRFTDQTIIRTTVSKGFRSPTIRELYLFRDASPNLKPEYLWNYEAGIQHSFGALLSADLTAFITEGNNLIRNQQTSLTPKLTNSGSFTHRGVEISASSSPVENVTLNTNYSYLDPANETRSVPQHKFFAEMLIAYNFIEASASVQHVSKIYGDDFSRQRLPDYTLVGLKLNIQILTSLSLFISGENLLNQSYQTIYDYPMPGRMMNIGVKAKY
jgi:iron complex outermembrane receptor protein